MKTRLLELRRAHRLHQRTRALLVFDGRRGGAPVKGRCSSLVGLG
jgi:hypothetical protein